MAITAFTSGAIIDATAIGKTVLTASSEGVAADAIGLGLSDSPTFADGTYTGTLTAQQGLLVNVGGSQKIYGVGTDGDANTEYIETSWDGTTAKIQTKETGTGAVRKLDVLAGTTGMKAYANGTLLLSSAWTTITMNNSYISLPAPTNGHVAIRFGDLRPYDAVTPINCGQAAVPWAGVYSVDGSFTGNLNTEIGGTQRVYNLGTEGDTDTEYLETSWDTNVAAIETKATGSGAARELRLVNGLTSIKLENAIVTLKANNQNILRGSGSSATYLYSHGNGTILEVGDGEFKPFTGTVALGSTAKRWSNTHSVDGDFSGDVVMAANVDFTGLPTSDPLVAGRLWNDSGTMKISAG